MKWLFRTIITLVLVLALGVAWLLAATFIGRRATLDRQEFDRIRVVAAGFSSAGIVPTRDQRVILIDAGGDDTGEAILGELSGMGLGPSAVAAILLTHGHSDHTAAVARFPDAQVMALGAEVPLVEGRAGSLGPVTRLFPVSPTGVKVTGVLRDGQVVTLGGARIRVYAVPGHTAGSAAFLADGVLFVGDSADVTTDGALQGAPWIFSDSQAENRASLVRLEQRLVADRADVTAIVPSHSGYTPGLAPLSEFARENQ
ncbi:MAG: MBL fold metallo-hydrolase [Acidobacteria bacterium]|nr:MBL fold metallo-hydrolase [Acidobacteriota bacterium]